MKAVDNFPIDFVMYWVDDSDPEWQKSKAQYESGQSNQSNGITRFRDWELLKYWFRGVEKFAPWVNNIYFVTCGHYPKWLNLENEKLKFVRHDEFIPNEYLPTFSANPIELNLHRLPDLSENFVVFNDDLFILRPVRKDVFFKNGLPRDAFIQSFTAPVHGAEIMCAITYNDLEVINRHYNKMATVKANPFKYFSLLYGKSVFQNLYAFPIKLTGIKSLHSAYSYKKSTYERLWERDFDKLDKTCKNKFRSRDDVNQWVLAWDQIMRGEFEPIKPKTRKYFTIGDDNSITAILKQNCDVICLNDGNASVDFENEKNKLISAFEKILPDKSSFEK